MSHVRTCVQAVILIDRCSHLNAAIPCDEVQLAQISSVRQQAHFWHLHFHVGQHCPQRDMAGPTITLTRHGCPLACVDPLQFDDYKTAKKFAT